VGCIGIDIDAQAERVASDVRRIGSETSELLGAKDSWDDELVEVVAGFAKPGCGLPDPATLDAISIAARFEGLALDPVYSGKGMQGLIGLIRAGRFRPDDTISGFTPADCQVWFAYPAAMNRAATTTARRSVHGRSAAE
jgi:L-cysteate sulfo-lyase